MKFFVSALLKNTRPEKFPGAVHYGFPDNHITSLLGCKTLQLSMFQVQGLINIMEHAYD